MRTYTGKNLDMISYPMGGIGAGMICLTGTGALASVSLRHRPQLHNHPRAFSAITILGDAPVCRVLEAPVPDAQVFGSRPHAGMGLGETTYGLPRFSRGAFQARFPFATIALDDNKLPIRAEITGWSPFVPGDADASSLPFAALEYALINTGKEPVQAVYYFCAENFMKADRNATVKALEDGFALIQPATAKAPHMQGALAASVDAPAFVDTAWFRGGWFDAITMLWNTVSKGECANRAHPDPERGASPGATLAVPLSLEPGERKTIRLRLSWFVPYSDLRIGDDEDMDASAGLDYPAYRPWYTTRIESIEQADALWRERYNDLRARTLRFTDAFFGSTLPEEILDAASANLSILKSPTVLRQRDGRLWGWEGCNDEVGSCHGSCTHVWNYAQALCNLFPALERTLRETEFFQAQHESIGHQEFRAFLPIRKTRHVYHAASDGQLGGIVKVYRDWRISGDTEWLRAMWPKVRQSLDYCIGQWDPDRSGVIRLPHHNTYDIEFWGPNGMSMSFYLSALRAACRMAEHLGEPAGEYARLYEKGRAYMESQLFNGEYFYQIVQDAELGAGFDPSGENGETRVLLEAEGPKYQYGTGCLSDGVLGAWLGEISGLEDIVDEDMLRKNLMSIYRYNFKSDLSAHANPQRPGYALKEEGGLLLCTWPRGGKPSLPFVYSDEVWTGIEYQVASHLLAKGFKSEGLEIVRACRGRYDGSVRNPYDEYECGRWYARAMASYALLQSYTGVRYDAVTKTLYYSTHNSVAYRAFLTTATGYAVVHVDGDAVKLDVRSGEIDVAHIVRTDA